MGEVDAEHPEHGEDAGRPADALSRWEASGAGWRVARRTPDQVVVELLSCDALDVVGSVVGSPAELDSYLGDRRTSED